MGFMHNEYETQVSRPDWYSNANESPVKIVAMGLFNVYTVTMRHISEQLEFIDRLHYFMKLSIK